MGLGSKLLKVPVIGKRLLRLIVKREGGEKESETLRQYTKQKYKTAIGKYTYGSCFLPGFNGGGEVSIGRYCSFGGDIHYFGANHPMDHSVMSAYFYNKKFGGLDVKDVPREKLEIGHDCWIGYGTIIVSSCHKIGNGAVVAAGSVVTKDVPAYAVVGGTPARIIKYRFDEETQKAIEATQWWKKTPEELYAYYQWIDQPQIWAKRVADENTIV